MGRTVCAQATAAGPIPLMGAGFSIHDHGPDINNPDDSPAVDPLNHLDKIGVHSDLDYLGFQPSRVFQNVTIPASNSTTAVPWQTTLFAHGVTEGGEGVKPLIMARASQAGLNQWFTLNGETHVFASVGLMGRSLFVQWDETNVYFYASSVGNLNATSLDIEVWVIDRTFDVDFVPTDEVIYADGDEVRAGFGAFDTNRNYLQGAGADPATLNMKTGQTILLRDGNLGGEKEFAIDDGVLTGGTSNYTVGLPRPPYADGAPAFNTVPSVPLILKAPGTVSESLRIDTSGIQLSNAAGEKTFDTSRQLVAVLDEWRGTINIPSHPVALWTTNTVSTVVHVDVPCHSACNIILGWLEVTSSSANILTDKPTDFSGSLDLWSVGYTGTLIYTNAFGQLASAPTFWRRGAVVLSPKIENGRLKIIEQFYSDSIHNSPNTPTPAISVKVHLFAAALTGGF